jgi:serine/threonine protein kinase
LRTGRAIGEFVLLRCLRVGSCAELWQAATTTGATVAVKVAGGTAISPSRARAHLRREYRLLASLAHSGILQAHALVDESGIVALVTEYLAGGDLVSVAGEPPRHWAVAIESVVAALTFVHSRGLVHRDVKARNVMFDVAGNPRLIDFGSAAAIGSPAGAGGTTSAHRNPHASDVSPADDVYALAVLIHELFEGRLPRADAAAARPKPALYAVSSAGARLRSLVSRTLAASNGAAIEPLAVFREQLRSLIAEEGL